MSFAKQGTGTETIYGPGCPARPPEASSESACLLEFWIKFSRVSSTQKRVFRRRSVVDLTNLRSRSQIFDKFVCHISHGHDVCGVCGED